MGLEENGINGIFEIKIRPHGVIPVARNYDCPSRLFHRRVFDKRWLLKMSGVSINIAFESTRSWSSKLKSKHKLVDVLTLEVGTVTQITANNGVAGILSHGAHF